MIKQGSTKIPFVDSVFHPSDFSQTSENAFAHALAIALLRKSEFTILHAGGEPTGGQAWRQFPAVRATLERWGLLEPGSPQSAVFEELEVRIQKVNLITKRPYVSIRDHLKHNPTDLIVLATEGRAGMPRWINPSGAEKLARESRTKTLFVPKGAKGFVSAENGDLSLKKVLVPVDARPDPKAALVYASRAAGGMMVDEMVEINLLHIGNAGDMPRVRYPEEAGNCTWNTLSREGNVVDGIIGTAKEISADMIVMATLGHEGFLDALRGSVTEQVVRQSPCPVLTVPVG